jgi:hypothetical protein
MANLTIAIDDDVLKKARLKALQQGTSVNAVLRDYLGQYAGATPERERAVRKLLELASRSRATRGRRRWTRDELHERR